MACSSDDDYSWTQETFTLQQIVERGELPTVVKVSEGIYSTNESETFSNGDLLKLDFVKSIAKVSARIVNAHYDETGQFIEEDHYGYLKSKGDVLIPLGYHGKVQIARPQGYKKYHSVQQLLKDFPRYVRVDKAVTAFTSKREQLTIPSGSKLELKREFEGNKLLCVCNDKDVLLDYGTTGVFVLMGDENFYTLQEIVDTLPLPQYVKFVDSEFQKVMTESLDEALENCIQYSGPVQLLHTVLQRVVVGHHKPATQTQQSSKFCRRALAILPLDSKTAREIPFQLPIYSGNPDEYEFMVARSFGDTQMDALDGGLYLEFAKNPKIHLIQSINEVLGPSAKQDDAPPPVPPRTWLYSDSKSDTPRRNAPAPPDEEENIYEIEEEITSPKSRKDQAVKGSPYVKPKTVGITTPPSKKEPATKNPTKPEPKADDGSKTDLVIADLSFKQTSMREKHLAKVPEKIKNQMKEMQKQLVQFVRSKSFLKKETSPKITKNTAKGKSKIRPEYGSAPKQSVSSIDEDDDEDEEDPNLYDYPDLSKMEIVKRNAPPKPDLEYPKTTSDKGPGPKFVQTIRVDGGQQPNIVKPQFKTGITANAPQNVFTNSQGLGKGTSRTVEMHGKKPVTVARVQPQSHSTHNVVPTRKLQNDPPSERGKPRDIKRQSSSTFSNLSVSDVAKLLKSCRLTKMAEKCNEQTLDGKILCSFDDQDLQDDFSLSAIKLKKFKLLSEDNWTPKLGHQGQTSPTGYSKSTFVFSDLSVMEVLFLLRANGLNKMADECEEESLDGRFLSNCDHKELKEYFSLNAIEMKKFELVKKDGYTPRVE